MDPKGQSRAEGKEEGSTIRKKGKDRCPGFAYSIQTV